MHRVFAITMGLIRADSHLILQTLHPLFILENIHNTVAIISREFCFIFHKVTGALIEINRHYRLLALSLNFYRH
jgi:hypothetical protein